MELKATIEINSKKITDVHPAQNTYEVLFFNKTGNNFNTFYKKYYTKLVWIIQKMNINTIDAEDLANQAFMQSLNKIEMYNPQYNYSTWLFDIGKKMAYQFKKNAKKREILVDTTTDGSDDDNNYDPVQYYLRNKMDTSYMENDTHLISNEKYNETLKEIAKLDPKYKTIIELADIHGKSYNEIKDALGVELQTVKNRLHHGRTRLETNLKKKFHDIELTY